MDKHKLSWGSSHASEANISGHTAQKQAAGEAEREMQRNTYIIGILTQYAVEAGTCACAMESGIDAYRLTKPTPRLQEIS